MPIPVSTLPFELDDDLAEPLASFIVVRLIFEASLQESTVQELSVVLDRWLHSQRSQALSGEADPTGEAVQMGDQTLEFQVYGLEGNPDMVIAPLLQDLSSISWKQQRISRIEMD